MTGLAEDAQQGAFFEFIKTPEKKEGKQGEGRNVDSDVENLKRAFYFFGLFFDHHLNAQTFFCFFSICTTFASCCWFIYFKNWSSLMSQSAKIGHSFFRFKHFWRWAVILSSKLTRTKPVSLGFFEQKYERDGCNRMRHHESGLNAV